MTVCAPPNKEDHQQLLAWAGNQPMLATTLRELSHFASTHSGGAGQSIAASFEEWVSVRLGSRSPYVWHLQWIRVLGPYLLFFESPKANGKLLRAVYIPGTTPVLLGATHPDSGKRENILYIESLYGAYFGDDEDAREDEAPLVWRSVLVDQRRTFLHFEFRESLFRWKLKLLQVATTRSEFSGVRFGQPQSIQHLLRVNETASSRPGRTRVGEQAPAVADKDIPKNIGVKFLPERMLHFLRQNGLTDEEIQKHTIEDVVAMQGIVNGTSEHVGPKAKETQFTKLNFNKKVTLSDLTVKESVEQLYADLVLVDQGMQGKVYRAVARKTRQTVAVKKIVLKNEATELIPLINEINVLSQCAHPNIVSLLTCHQQGKEISIVMEFMSGGKLTDILDEEEGIGHIMSEREIATITFEVASGLQYLHERNIMHRDIKSDNILMNDNGDVKLGDFGFATSIESPTGGINSRKTLVGTPYWMAPEITKGQAYDFKADNWSLGILFLELCDNLPPWMGLNPIKALSKISLSPPPKIAGTKRSLSSLAHEFAAFVLVKDPRKRPTISEICAHPFLAASNRMQDKSALKVHVERLLTLKGRKK
ncbi:protein kinase, putative [Bodo saltans]|uniref:Protein kinase, putative n=1 Tax=Bodo saltans TaxID=75058 RepID=A0A0S4JQA2_BODSA|nr:protein kinase, putative [Bodo saltans]|eukprot:CUG92141.1 protein kinase, putative [Bodo saltans]